MESTPQTENGKLTTHTAPPRGEELVARARALAPRFAERLAETDARRSLTEATVQDMQEAGFFRMLQPARWGGFESDPGAFFDVQMAVAEGCPSAAWVLGVVAVHSWQLALFDERAQQDVWGADRSVLISSSYAPTGQIERVEGGFKVTGRWSFSSGCDHCQWVFLGGFVPVAEGSPPDMRTFLLPRADYRIDDNWHTMGLRGTGSKDIVVEGAFVPEHRTHRFTDGFKQNSPGNAVNPAPLFRLPFGQIFVRSVSTTAIGIAQAALASFIKTASSRVAAGDGSKVALDPTTQVVCSRAEQLIDECRLVLHRNMSEMMTAVREGRPIAVDRRAKFRNDSGQVVTKCVEAVDLLFTASGGRAIFHGHPLQRLFLDVHCARAHYANGPDKPARNLGGVLLGQKTTDFFI